MICFHCQKEIEISYTRSLNNFVEIREWESQTEQFGDTLTSYLQFHSTCFAEIAGPYYTKALENNRKQIK